MKKYFGPLTLREVPKMSEFNNIVDLTEPGMYELCGNSKFQIISCVSARKGNVKKSRPNRVTNRLNISVPTLLLQRESPLALPAMF